MNSPLTLSSRDPYPLERSPAIDSELDLVRRAQAGDRRAFEALYRLEVGRVYAVCLRMVGDRRRAETLTQDAFVHAWQHLDDFREDSAFSTWLHRIAVNEVLMALRAERRRQARVACTDDWSAHDGMAHDGAALQSAPESVMDLERAIAALPEQARAVLVLHDVEGYRHREISEMMEIAVGTSKAHLHRARKLLRAMLS